MSNLGPWTDSHCHLLLCAADPGFSERLEAYLDAGGVVLDVGIEEGDEEVRRSLWKPGVYHSCGVHPNQTATGREPDWQALRDRLRHGACAVGETGLDFFRHPETRETQIQWFRHHLEIAVEQDLPVIVHCRQSFEEVLNQVRLFPSVRGVMHCFSEDWPAAEAALDRGFFLSFAGNLTYPKNQALREVARQVPADRWLVETDAPFLTPHPYRYHRNHPDRVGLTLRAMAEIRGLDPERAAAQARENFLRLFNRCGG